MPKRRRYGSRPGSSKRARTSYRKRGRRRRRTRRSGRGPGAVSSFVHGISSRRGPNCLNLRSIGFPDSMIAHLCYREYGDLQNANPYVVPGQYQFRLNALRDPNYTGVGKQPRYFDELCSGTLYKHFVVYRADVIATLRHNGPSTDIMVGAAVRSSTAAPFVTSAQMYYDAELPYTGTRMLQAEGADHSATTFKFSLPMHKFFGVKKEKIYNDDFFHGTYSTDPAAQCVFTIAVNNDPSDTAASAGIDFEVSVIYHVKFWSLQDTVAQS